MKNFCPMSSTTTQCVLIGNSGMVDPFDNWTQTQRMGQSGQGLPGCGTGRIFYDNEEYNVHMWQYPNDCKYASSKTAAQYQEQWRLRGTQVMQAIIAQWPQAKILVTIGPNR